MQVSLNGNTYVLVEGSQVRRSPIQDYPQNIRLDGQQSRKDRSNISAWAIDNWSGGLGLQRIKTDVAGKVFRLWDVENCDTRWSDIYPSPAFQTCTVNPLNIPFIGAFEHQNNIYFFENNTSPGIAWKFAAPVTIGSYFAIGTRAADVPQQILGAISADGMIYWAANVQGLAPQIFSVGGVGSQAGEQKGSLSINTNEVQFANLGGTIHVLAHARAVQLLQFAIIAPAPGITNGSQVPVATISAQVGTYLPKMVTDGVNCYAQLPEGIYDFDATPAIVVDHASSKEKNGALALYQNNLYFKHKTSLVKYDGVNLTSIGYNKEDGLPSDKMGQITAMTSNWQYLFAAVQGPTYSHILTHDENHAWQYYARIPTPGLWVKDLFASDAPDGIDRLWVIYGSYAYPGYFYNPFITPQQAGTYSYVPTGYVTWPIYDGGMDDYNAVWTQHISKSRGILNGSLAQVITNYYALDNASAMVTLNTLGTSHQTAIYGSPYGVTARRIQPKMMIAYDSANYGGSPPIFEKSIIEYLKKPTQRYTYEFDVDVDATMQRETRDAENIIGSLISEMGLVAMMPFWYGQMPTTEVLCIDPALNQDTIPQLKEYPLERKTVVRMKVSEMI